MQVQRINNINSAKTQNTKHEQTGYIGKINNSLNIDSVSFKATTAPSQTKRLLEIAAGIVDSGATLSPKSFDGWVITFIPRSQGVYELGATKGTTTWTYVCNPARNHANVYGTFPNGICQGAINFPFQDDPEMLKLLQGLNLGN